MDIIEMWYENQVAQTDRNLHRMGRFSKVASVAFTATLVTLGAVGVSVAGADDLQKIEARGLTIRTMDVENLLPTYTVPSIISTKILIKTRTIVQTAPIKTTSNDCYSRRTEIFPGQVTICDNTPRRPNDISKRASDLAALTR